VAQNVNPPLGFPTSPFVSVLDGDELGATARCQGRVGNCNVLVAWKQWSKKGWVIGVRSPSAIWCREKGFLTASLLEYRILRSQLLDRSTKMTFFLGMFRLDHSGELRDKMNFLVVFLYMGYIPLVPY